MARGPCSRRVWRSTWCWFCRVLLKNWTVWCFRSMFYKFTAASNSSIPVHSKDGYFQWFSIIRHTDCCIQTSKCTISTFSAEINNQKSCRKMWFSSSKYTKMHLWQGLCPGPNWGSLQHSPSPPSCWWGGRGLTASLPKISHPAIGPAGLEFSDLGLKEVVHPCNRWSRQN